MKYLTHYYLLVFLALMTKNGLSQDKSLIMDESVYSEWNRITGTKISNNGKWVVYHLTKEIGDGQLKIYNTETQKTYTFDRAEKSSISSNNEFVCFYTKVPYDKIRVLKKKKTPKSEFPKDTLSIFDLKTNALTKIANCEEFKLPEVRSNFIAYKVIQAKQVKVTFEVQDSLKEKKLKKRRNKKHSKEENFDLVIKNLKTAKEDTLQNIIEFHFAKESNRLIATTSKVDSNAGVYFYNLKSGLSKQLLKGKADFYHPTFNELGTQVAIIIDRDTTELKVRPYELFYWEEKYSSLQKIASNKSSFLAKNWSISSDYKPIFSKKGNKLFFGIKPAPILKDTSLLEEETVNVEVWSYTDDVLYTQQEVKLRQEEKKSCLAVYNIPNKSFRQLTDTTLSSFDLLLEGDHPYILAENVQGYQKQISWLGYPKRDLFLVNVATGRKEKIASQITGNVWPSPAGKYAYWYSRPDSAWLAIDLKSRKEIVLADNTISKFFDEKNDKPMHPYPNGFTSWGANDEFVLINDRYDIWKLIPGKKEKAKRITNGRANDIRYRYIKLDPKEKYVNSNDRLLFYHFNEKNKSSGYTLMHLWTAELVELLDGPYRFNYNIKKAKNASDLVFTKEAFELFPDLIHSNDLFKTNQRFSDANPQQKEYKWGTINLEHWVSKDGKKLEGLLVKPGHFDPNKKYPLLVNFYEKSSDGLHRHRAPFAHRSTINYAYYANRGYVVFNPNVIYKDGYPGESCYNAVISGIEHIVKNGFIDEQRIGVQGHSWGGYQVAHLLTKTDIFACAEAGAPVVNMTSAYGGIRWRSGMSRMFQYERTQSRIGGTLWEVPKLYIENSPIFNIDKVNTPVLILHNDQDGAVPWYQGIEYFVALRRLEKVAWMLNYNDEPHWPEKWHNRLDFNIRMQQFFDHYLMKSPMPNWMKEGVPPIKKGKKQGLEID